MVSVVVLVVVALLFKKIKSPLPDVARKFICSSSNVADMVVPTLDNRGNIKTQTMLYLCLRLVFLQSRRQLVSDVARTKTRKDLNLTLKTVLSSKAKRR